MNCNGEDMLNIDFDPDFLIDLVGKLSLNNLPDLTEALQSIENNKNTSSFETELRNATCSSSSTPFVSDISVFNQAKDTSCTVSSNNENKDGFQTSDLLSASHTTETPLPQDNFLDNASNLWNALASDSKKNKESCRAKEKLEKSKDISSKKKTNQKKVSDPNFQENSACDNAESHWQGLPFLSGANFPHKSVNSVADVFSQRGMIYDIELNDIGGSLKLPFNIDAEAGNSNQLPLDEREDLAEKSVCSPDSEINTSPSSAVSPHSPPTDLECADDSEEYDDSSYEDDLQRLLAELIEMENYLRYADIPPSNANVPVLKDAKNAEDHIEKILNFLKEPICDDLNSQLPQCKQEDEKPGFPELFVENTAQSIFKLSSKHIKKPSPRSKKNKFGVEFKYAGKNEIRQSIFSKGKPFSSRNKILKKIQKDERIQKQVKVIQRLIVSRKLKRSDIDDRETKKRRIQPNDCCHKSQ